MIASIDGLLLDKSTSQAIIEANGVGYLVYIPLSTYYELPDLNSRVKLYIHTSFKQESLNLFGFATIAEREMFQLLLTVSGIGPKLAINILSGISVEDLARALSGRDLRRISKVPGIGKKTAERLVLELNEKVAKLFLTSASPGPKDSPSRDEEFRQDAVSALVNLGYKNQTAEEVVDKVLGNATAPLTMDVLLKQTLKLLTE